MGRHEAILSSSISKKVKNLGVKKVVVFSLILSAWIRTILYFLKGLKAITNLGNCLIEYD